MNLSNKEFSKTLDMPAEFQAKAAAFADAKGLSLAAREVIASHKDGWTGRDGKRREPSLMLVVSAEAMMALGLRERTFAPVSTEFTSDGSAWLDVWINPAPPAACRVTFEVEGIDAPVRVVHTWAEYVQGKATGTQLKMPAMMLAKATRCLGIRQIAPSATGGLLSEEEAVAVEGAIDAEVAEIAEIVEVVTPPQDKEAKGSTIPRSQQFAMRKDELVKLGKALRADCGDDAARELSAFIKSENLVVDKLLVNELKAITKKAADIRAAIAENNAMDNVSDMFDAEPVEVEPADSFVI